MTRSWLRLGCFVALAMSVVASASATERRLAFTQQDSEIRWTLEATGHDVTGRFELVGGEIVWDPETGVAGGLIEIDATSARTGNTRRDATMHEDVLESDRYPRFRFRPERVEGVIQESTTSSIRLHGVLSIHGADHALTLLAHVAEADGRMTIESAFDIPFVAWGMKDPSLLFLRVAKQVRVRLSATATVTTKQPAEAPPR